MLIDYHTHNERCGHAEGCLREYVEMAIKYGLSEIGLSDHMPVIHIPGERLLPGLAMEINELEGYVKEVLELKQEYKKDIAVKLGLEADYVKGFEEKTEKLLSTYPFDYVIGSVHFLNEWDISDSRQLEGWKQKSADNVYSEYYNAVSEAALTGLFDIVGHFDVIKKFGFRPEKSMETEIERTLRVLKKCDMVMELNVSGLHLDFKETYPAPEIIKKAVDFGISFTVGSDAHKPEHVHRSIEEGRKRLSELGVKELITFEKRKKIVIPLTNASDISVV